MNHCGNKQVWEALRSGAAICRTKQRWPRKDAKSDLATAIPSQAQSNMPALLSYNT